MTLSITKKITSASVVSKTGAAEPKVPLKPLERALKLRGMTYKIKPPTSEHALYITINNLNGKQCEIFINSKDMGNFQWIVALTHVISAVFRHGGDCAFLPDELLSVFDPKGGYFRKGGKFVPSLVAEIGEVLKHHMQEMGLIEQDNSLAVAAKAMLADKASAKSMALCAKCNETAVVVLDGCMTCTNCGDSKCG